MNGRSSDEFNFNEALERMTGILAGAEKMLPSEENRWFKKKAINIAGEIYSNETLKADSEDIVYMMAELISVLAKDTVKTIEDFLEDGE